MLGYTNGFCPKFVKRYANIHDIIVDAVKEYKTECADRTFPAAANTFSIDDAVIEKLY